MHKIEMKASNELLIFPIGNFCFPNGIKRGLHESMLAMISSPGNVKCILMGNIGNAAGTNTKVGCRITLALLSFTSVYKWLLYLQLFGLGPKGSPTFCHRAENSIQPFFDCVAKIVYSVISQEGNSSHCK